MLDVLLNQVRNAIGNHAQQQNGQMDAGGLIGQIESLFGQHAANTGQILPASQDPYGDPANQGYNQGYNGGGILPASQDPMGDPADNGGILPASMDPLGDPAGRR